MVESKHTPAPWKAVHKGERLFSHVVHDLKEIRMFEGVLIDQPNGNSSTIHSQNSEADANLIAAAPELLEALEGMQKLLNDIFDSNDMGKMCFQNYALLNEAPILAKKIIAKARGVTKNGITK